MKKKKIPWGPIYVVLTFAVLLVFGFVNREFVSVFSVASGLPLGFLAAAVLMTAVFLVMEGEIIRLLLRCQGERVGFWTTLKIGLIGIYYSYITPSSTGGQPAQVMYLRRDRVLPGSSAAVLFVKFFAYQSAFVLCCIGSLIYMYPALQAEKPQLIPAAIIGTAINALWVIGIPLLFCPPVLHGLCGLIVKLLDRCRFLRKRAVWIEKMRGFEQDFADYTQRFRKKLRYVVLAVLLSIPQAVLQMSVLYVVFLAFGSEALYAELLSMQTLLQAAVCFMPMPGASGAQEIGFSVFFDGYFPSSGMLYTAVLVWRFFTYYIIVIAGAVLVMADQLLYRKKKLNEIF
ncbi:MAG: flippase-like domain-containing protein [Clostridia bacterium]|nr:flippase-like domain-containing protein [Clostridia bacterium]